MATYSEIHNAVNGSTFAELRKKVSVAALVKAKAVIADPSAPEQRLNWAKGVFGNIERESEELLLNMLASNVSQPINSLAAASDEAVQTHTSAAIDALYS